MTVVAYIANQFPSPMEPYVMEEIVELRKRGVEVIACSVHRPRARLDSAQQSFANEALYLRPLRFMRLLEATGLCLSRRGELADLVGRLRRGPESPGRRFRAILHTWLGAYYALALQGRGVQHIHAHHGYFGSWIAMVAARLLGIDFSMTLHGSDLLLCPTFLDAKLTHCKFCYTVSEFNRRRLLERYPEIAAEKIIVRRLGVDTPYSVAFSSQPNRQNSPLVMLAVGRLHPVKDHAFLVYACAELKDLGVPFLCVIAGEGPERARLERLIRRLELQEEVTLAGHLSRQQLDAYYSLCDLVVLTSQSEGIPLTLMEAMAYGKTVLAPEITGIPELVIEGKTGFLYQAGSLEDFVAKVETIAQSQPALGPVRREARRHVFEHFNRQRNLASFANLFLSQVSGATQQDRHEDPVLQ